MRVYFLIQNFFSLLNIGLILYLLLINEEKNDKKNVKDFFSLRKIGCILFVFVMRLLENKIQIRIFYVYLSVILIVLVLGYIYKSSSIMNNLLLAGIFLLIISLSQVIAGIVGFFLTKGKIELYQLQLDGQMGLLAVAETSIIISVFLVARIVRKIPSKISSK